MKDYFIALVPEKKFYSKINSIKNLILKKFGNQQYLLDPPHLTLFVGRTKNLEPIKKEIENMKFKKTLIKIKNLSFFRTDKITKKQTIAFFLSRESEKKLREMQLNVILKIARYNSGIVDRYKNINFSKKEFGNLKNFGYPFVGKNWTPHITICSADKNVSSQILSLVNKKFLKSSIYIRLNRIAFYRLIKEEPKLYFIKYLWGG
ncbi:MAG: hypothetical protein ACQXXF_07175 [Thermoplasmatota archaeon]|jgi:2'-5' RNA ligase